LGAKKWEMVFVPGFAIGALLQLLIGHFLPVTTLQGYLNQLFGLHVWFAVVGIISLIAWIMELENKSA
jgi:hypothetical protein